MGRWMEAMAGSVRAPWPKQPANETTEVQDHGGEMREAKSECQTVFLLPEIEARKQRRCPTPLQLDYCATVKSPGKTLATPLRMKPLDMHRHQPTLHPLTRIACCPRWQEQHGEAEVVANLIWYLGFARMPRLWSHDQPLIRAIYHDRDIIDYIASRLPPPADQDSFCDPPSRHLKQQCGPPNHSVLSTPPPKKLNYAPRRLLRLVN
ncbi:hypothetical protein NLI96_g12096 [Meripilus lineatus]|uniref:Uncharacterized protein n=1 Tax=Meripilus lineatus TaxID=2056292 RepID=A0AAD5UVF3_9APHY|nr:hypothetical protein NLI96_g12096 [Physisporinus lineatus]